jgi:glycosyltransferase involved in cell wall biosynthesis
MPSITALLHTEDDALRLGRCLETLHPCDKIVVVDHGSRDLTVRIAREYGAIVLPAERESSPNFYLQHADPAWVFCLDPRESFTEGLSASLFEWKLLPLSPTPSAFSVQMREETDQGWAGLPTPQTRLVPYGWNRWMGRFPINEPSAATLEGELLRFTLP